jgi:hypothetical protein
MPRIFISYRRSDSEIIAGRIYDRLVAAFGEDNIFMDIDDIPPGLDFRDVIDQALAKTDVMLAIIGPDWLDEKDVYGNRRIELENDWVRAEIARGLRNDYILVIPVLVKDAKAPPVNMLPPSLQTLSFLNAVDIHRSQHFHRDMNRLIQYLRQKSAW